MIKKALVIAILAYASYWAVMFFVGQYDEIEKNVNTPDKKGGSGLAAQYGVVGPDFGQDSARGKSPPMGNAAKTATPTVPHKTSNDSLVAPTGKPHEVICTGDLDAFNPANPAEKGKFLRGSILTIGSRDANTGMYEVTFVPKDGPVVHALCRAKDLGL